MCATTGRARRIIAMAVCMFFCVVCVAAAIAEECDDGTTKACAAGKDTAARNISARAAEIDERAVFVSSLLLLLLVGARRRTVMVGRCVLCAGGEDARRWLVGWCRFSLLPIGTSSLELVRVP